MSVTEMSVGRSDCECLLSEGREIAQEIPVRRIIRIITQLHVVKSGQAYEDQFISGIDLCLELDLSVYIVRKHRKSEQLEKELKI